MELPTGGAHTRREILSQPRCWADCFQALDSQGQLRQVGKRWTPPPEWAFIGCGSSYYVALGAAATWTALTGQPAQALPASELLLFPQLVLNEKRPCQPVLISRSGHTSEVLKVAEILEAQHNIRTLAISCATHQPLEEISTLTPYVLPADEESNVMTRSFTSMLLGLQALGAEQGKREEFTEGLRRLPGQVEPLMEELSRRVQQFVETHAFADYVYLGQGPFFGIANEGMLKVKEMSCSYGQCFHTLEFRHGPKGIVGPETLVTFFLSESGYEEEREVLEEVKGLGATTMVVANHADSAARRGFPRRTQAGPSGIRTPGGVHHPRAAPGSVYRSEKGLQPRPAEQPLARRHLGRSRRVGRDGESRLT
ncbi:MAG: SIS domain-containing protein [Acidobacteriia bacterium]|nr:SIS domain-containing protein [Terriglobia bacterium]